MALQPEISTVAAIAARASTLHSGLPSIEGHPSSRATTVSPLVAMVLQGDQIASVREGSITTGRMSLNASIDDLVSRQGGSDGTGFDIAPTRSAGIFNAPARPLRLLSVLPRIPVDSNTFEFVQLDGYVNKADYQVNEGDGKAKTAIPTDIQQASIATIAHWVRTSSQVLSDEPALEQQVGNLLQYGTLAKLENEIVVGVGGKGKILGLLPSAQPANTTVALGMADRIGEAITQLEVDGWVPGLVLMNPNDWQSLRSERDKDGQYISGGWATPGKPSIWNLPLVTTPSLPAGTALVLDPQQVLVLDRMQPILMASRDDQDNFTTNRVTLLSELRAGLAVLAPFALLKVTLIGEPDMTLGTAASKSAKKSLADAPAGV